jgi:hypothetical protein
MQLGEAGAWRKPLLASAESVTMAVVRHSHIIFIAIWEEGGMEA